MALSASHSSCYLPEGCRFESVYDSEIIYNYNDKGFNSESTIMCDIDRDKYEFMLKDPERGKFMATTKDYIQGVVFKWKSWPGNELSILEKQFNFTNAMKYFGNLLINLI